MKNPHNNFKTSKETYQIHIVWDSQFPNLVYFETNFSLHPIFLIMPAPLVTKLQRRFFASFQFSTISNSVWQLNQWIIEYIHVTMYLLCKIRRVWFANTN